MGDIESSKHLAKGKEKMNTNVHEVWFACEFHGGSIPVFSKNTDVTWWEGIKFFYNKEDAIKHAHDLATQNMKSLIGDNLDYEDVFYGEGLDVFNWNRLVKEYDLPAPYLLMDKYEVVGDRYNEFTALIVEWEEDNKLALHTSVAGCFSTRKQAVEYVRTSFNMEEYVKTNSKGDFKEIEFFLKTFKVSLA